PVAPAEVEALVRPELAVGVLAAMAASGNAAGRHGEPLRAGVIAKPNEPLPLLLRRRPDLGLGGPEGAREALERRHRVCPDPDEVSHPLEQRALELVRVDRDEKQ